MKNFDRVQKQYTDFLAELEETHSAEQWEKFWDRWVVCKVKDYWKFVEPHMYLNKSGKPVVWLMHDDLALEAQDSREFPFEDLVAGCWSLWASKKASEEEIEKRLRRAFEAGLKKAKQTQLFE